MTRRLLAFFAPGMLMAQTKAKPHYTIDRIEEPPSQAFPRSNPRPRNGECPVCGTMAQPYHVSTGDEHFNMGLTNFRRIDCEHCNTTFRQWAEGKGPKK